MDLAGKWQQATDMRLPSMAIANIGNCSDGSLRSVRCALLRYGIAVLSFSTGRSIDENIMDVVDFMGTPHVHDGIGRKIWDVRVGGSDGKESLAISHTDAEFTFHTDCCYENAIPGYIGLYIVHGDRLGGGVSLVANANPLINGLSEKAFEILRTRKFPIRVPLEFKKEVDQIDATIFDEDNNMRYRSDLFLRNEIDGERLCALQEFEKLLAAPSIWRKLSLMDGQLLLLDNKRYLHARTPILDKARHLKRVRFNMRAC
jgi:hypothetical protein